jgi:hypothetical protein
MSLTSLTIVAAEASHGEPAIHPYLVGVIVFGILAALIVVLLMFGAGREHS